MQYCNYLTIVTIPSKVQEIFKNFKQVNIVIWIISSEKVKNAIPL
jgi:hypothetical protein